MLQQVQASTRVQVLSPAPAPRVTTTRRRTHGLLSGLSRRGQTRTTNPGALVARAQTPATPKSSMRDWLTDIGALVGMGSLWMVMAVVAAIDVV